MIEVSEIKKVIDTLERSQDACMVEKNFTKADAYGAAAYLLKGLLPK